MSWFEITKRNPIKDVGLMMVKQTLQSLEFVEALYKLALKQEERTGDAFMAPSKLRDMIERQKHNYKLISDVVDVPEPNPEFLYHYLTKVKWDAADEGFKMIPDFMVDMMGVPRPEKIDVEKGKEILEMFIETDEPGGYTT